MIEFVLSFVFLMAIWGLVSRLFVLRSQRKENFLTVRELEQKLIEESARRINVTPTRFREMLAEEMDVVEVKVVKLRVVK